MRIALDQNGKLINIRDINSDNKGNKYYCPYCKTEVIVASFEGDYSTYFRAKNEHDKNSDCKYISDYSEKSNNIIDKHSLEDIFEGSSSNEKDNGKQDNNDNHNNNDDVNTFNVHTTKQLYAYCRANDYNTEYLNGLKIKDFFINKNTLDYNIINNGISGLKLVEGKVKRYYKETNSFKIEIDNIKNKLYVYLYIVDNKKLYREIRNVFYNNCENNQDTKIVLFGELNSFRIKDENYETDSFASNKSLIIYKF